MHCPPATAAGRVAEKTSEILSLKKKIARHQRRTTTVSLPRKGKKKKNSSSLASTMQKHPTINSERLPQLPSQNFSGNTKDVKVAAPPARASALPARAAAEIVDTEDKKEKRGEISRDCRGGCERCDPTPAKKKQQASYQ